MKLTDGQKKMLTEELLKECWIQDPVFLRNRTFFTWKDLGDCKEALVRAELWDSFMSFAWIKHHGFTKAGFTDWLFRPIDDQGEAHFCRLVAEWMKGRKVCVI